MSFKLNVFTGKFDYYENNFRGTLASAPSGPQQGWMYINSGNDTMYVYYGSSWQAIHNLTPSVATFLLTEAGDALLLESGDKIKLEA